MEVRGKEVEEPKLPSFIGFYNECDCLYVLIVYMYQFDCYWRAHYMCTNDDLLKVEVAFL